MSLPSSRNERQIQQSKQNHKQHICKICVLKYRATYFHPCFPGRHRCTNDRPMCITQNGYLVDIHTSAIRYNTRHEEL
jgi:hypothetical protein